MLNKIGDGSGAGGKGTAPTPTPTPPDMAGMACEMLGMIPDPKLLPLNFVILKMEHEELKRQFDMLINFLNEQGFKYDR